MSFLEPICNPTFFRFIYLYKLKTCQTIMYFNSVLCLDTYREREHAAGGIVNKIYGYFFLMYEVKLQNLTLLKLYALYGVGHYLKFNLSDCDYSTNIHAMVKDNPDYVRRKFSKKINSFRMNLTPYLLQHKYEADCVAFAEGLILESILIYLKS